MLLVVRGGGYSDTIVACSMLAWYLNHCHNSICLLQPLSTNMEPQINYLWDLSAISVNQLIYLPVTHHKSSHILTNGLQNPCLLLIIKRIWTGLNIVFLAFFQPSSAYLIASEDFDDLYHCRSQIVKTIGRDSNQARSSPICKKHALNMACCDS